jgi:hypothetical protein
MRKLRQRALVCAVWVIGAASTALAQQAPPDPKVLQAGHFFHKSQQADCSEVNVILEMEPAQAAPKSDCSTQHPARRCCLFGKHAHGDFGAGGGNLAVGNFVFTPALINLQGAANPVSTTFGTTVDLSRLRTLQEMGIHAAAYNAQQAAEQAANNYINRQISDLQATVQNLSVSAAKASEGAGADTTLNTQLKRIDDRLKGLEKLVQSHHDTLAILVPLARKKAQGKINTPLKDKQFTLTIDSNQILSFMVDDPDKVRIIDKDSNPTTTKLNALQANDPVAVTFEQVGDKLFAKEVQLKGP